MKVWQSFCWTYPDPFIGDEVCYYSQRRFYEAVNIHTERPEPTTFPQ